MLSKTILAVFVLSLGVSARADSVTNAFTFVGHETYPINDNISLLHVADLTGNGLNDIIVADNDHSKIDLLYNETGNTIPPRRPPSRKSTSFPPARAFI